MQTIQDKERKTEEKQENRIRAIARATITGYRRSENVEIQR